MLWSNRFFKVRPGGVFSCVTNGTTTTTEAVNFNPTPPPPPSEQQSALEVVDKFFGHRMEGIVNATLDVLQERLAFRTR